ncbi:kinase-like domain-containing protein [Cantharellus anzutake]|uniref:kinase-like domain-containing protein n=1 Tax=Cantharellus anzutake TaxID=1750568 RepID=UPI001908A908|nr:kinase-like domain-containing protein [Cantharellus anzutake]KAF8335714.1 kinase-like domain-containing protein [Cantharellus anzutake]
MPAHLLPPDFPLASSLPPPSPLRGSLREFYVAPVDEVEMLIAFDCPDLTQHISSLHQVDKGGYSLVYKGTWERGSPDTQSQEVAVKVLHVLDTDPEAKRWKRLKREMRVWSRLSHDNLAPLLGYVYYQNGQLGFVSPWYTKGNAINFIRNHPGANRDMIVRVILVIFLFEELMDIPKCVDVASGLEYLHSQNPSIVHGDIKGQNILITSDGRALICDFGLSMILDDNPTGFTSTVIGMTIRFSAPELLDGGEKTVEADVYAYGCTCIQILLGKSPYEDIRSDMALIRAIASGTLPVSPEQLKECDSCLPLHIVNQCWSSKPCDRPGAVELAKAFRGAFGL